MSKEEYKDEIKEEKPGGSSRLGKEAKIGVTVIALLLIVFGVVVAVRLRGSSSDDKPAVATDREDGRERAGHEGKTEATVQGESVEAVRRRRPAHGRAGEGRVGQAAEDHGRRSGPVEAGLRPGRSKAERWRPVARHATAVHARSAQAAAGRAARAVRLGSAGGQRLRFGRSRAGAACVSGALALRASAGATGVVPHGDILLGRRRTFHARHVGGPIRRGRLPSRVRRAQAPGGGSHRSAASLYNNPAARRDDGKYEVQPNDSYWTISERLYGTGAYFKALAQQNRGKGADEDRLQPGELILAPTVAELEKSYPDLCPKPSRREALQSQSQSRASTVSARNQYRGGRTYTVAEGDTLFNIARYELGKASRWAEIYDLNRDVLGKDFNYLTPGMQLVLPEGEKSDVIAQPPGNVYRR